MHDSVNRHFKGVATANEHYIKAVPESVRVAVESLDHLLKLKPGAVKDGQAN